MINKDFFQAIEDLEAQKGIKPEILLETLKNALVSAYKKHTGTSSDVMIDMNPEKYRERFRNLTLLSASERNYPACPAEGRSIAADRPPAPRQAQ